MSDEFRAEQFYPDEDYEEEEDDSNCGAFGQILFSDGSEECEFCPNRDACLKMTLEWEKQENKRHLAVSKEGGN